MREFNGRFWVPRDRRQRRAARQRALAETERLLRQTLQAERERAERERADHEASIERKHEMALAMNADLQADRLETERREWEQWLGKANHA